MNFWEHFLRLLLCRPKSALAALYWHVTRRKVRARNRLSAASADLPFAYRIWMAKIEKNPQVLRDASVTIENWAWHPRFSVLVVGPTDSSKEELARTIGSIDDQIYPYHSVLEGPWDAIASPIAGADGDFVVPLRIGNALSETALFHFAEELQKAPSPSILYGDEDELDDRGRRTRPWFKPRWNEEMFLAQDYLSSAVAIETDLARSVASEQSVDDIPGLVLRATAAAEGAIVHVPHIVCHVANERSSSRGSRRDEALSQHLQPLGATCAPGPFQTTKVEWPLPSKLPLVSIIVPTKDRIELLRPCLESVLDRTDYGNFEILIVDNGSVEAQTADFLVEISADPKVRVLNYPGRYNFSAINNHAAAQAHGSFLCLLNNDTEVVERAWLTELMRYAVRPEIGAVGPKLLYEDGSIQHAGVIIGIGNAAGHAHRFLPANSPGYFNMPHIAQFVSAVTAACLVVEKGKFEAVDGLDEESLAVAFNDVDLCLKLQSAGWRNVYVPHAVLLHHESKSRGSDAAPDQIDRYRSELQVLQERWRTKTFLDPLHNPNLDRYSETFVVRL